MTVMAADVTSWETFKSQAAHSKPAASASQLRRSMEAEGWRLEGVLRPLGGRERSIRAFRPGGWCSPYLGGQCWAP